MSREIRVFCAWLSIILSWFLIVVGVQNTNVILSILSMVMFFAFLTLYTTIVYNISRKQFSEELLEKERRNLMKLEDLLDILQQEVDKYIDEDKGY